MKNLATEIFSSASSRGVTYTLQCLNLVGKSVSDLMNPTEGTPVSVVDHEDEGVDFEGASKVKVSSTRELLSILRQCEEQRRLQSSGQAVYQITFWRGTAKVGAFTLVSCSGAERRKGSVDTNANSGLLALKECIRLRAQALNNSKAPSVPYRSSNLTRVLRECLEDTGSTLSVVGTVSPNATATEETIGTLKVLSNLVGHSWCEGSSRKITTKKVVEKAPLPPKDWGNPELVTWLSTRSLLGSKPIPCQLDGKSVMKMSRPQLQAALYEDDSDGEAKSVRLFRALRHESERVMRSDLRRKMTLVGLAS